MPGSYPFLDGTVDVRERHIEIWKSNPAALFQVNPSNEFNETPPRYVRPADQGPRSSSRELPAITSDADSGDNQGLLGLSLVRPTLCFAVQSGGFGLRGFFRVRYFHNGLLAVRANPDDMPVLDASRDITFSCHPANMRTRPSVFQLGTPPQSN